MVDYAVVPDSNGGGSVVGSVLLEHDHWFNQAIAVGSGVTLTLTPRTVAMESPCGFAKTEICIRTSSRRQLINFSFCFVCCC